MSDISKNMPKKSDKLLLLFMSLKIRMSHCICLGKMFFVADSEVRNPHGDCGKNPQKLKLKPLI